MTAAVIAPEPIGLDLEMAAARLKQAALSAGSGDPGRSIVETRALQLVERAWWHEDMPALAAREERSVPFRHRTVAVYRLVPPGGSAGAPLVYIHGGGWRFGATALDEGFLRKLAVESSRTIVSIDYTLAPEERFPWPVEEIDAVLDAVPDWLGPDGSYAIGGCSAGANLGLAVALRRRDRGARLPERMVLFYGVYDCDLDTASYHRFGGSEYGLGRDRMAEHWAQYVPDPARRTDPLASPLHADLAGLPPAFLAAAGADPLYDETIAMAARLSAAGVPAALKEYPGVCHGFVHLSRMVGLARQAIADAAAFLKE